MAEKIYPEGIRFFPKNPKSPDFVLSNVSFDRDKLIAWLQTQETDAKGYMRLQLLDGKETPYLTVDTYKPNK